MHRSRQDSLKMKETEMLVPVWTDFVETNRERSHHRKFTDEELDLLLECVDERKKVLLCRWTTSATKKQQMNEWQAIADRMSSTDLKRTGAEVERKFRAMEKAAERRQREIRLKRLQGRTRPPPLTKRELEVLRIVKRIGTVGSSRDLYGGRIFL